MESNVDAYDGAEANDERGVQVCGSSVVTGTSQPTRPDRMSSGSTATGPTNAMNPGNGVRLKKFTLFPSLPPELRLKIWKHALPDPRVVEVMAKTRRQTLGHLVYTFRTATRQGFTGALSRTCRDSRWTFMASYTKPEISNAPSSSHNTDPHGRPMVLYPCRGGIDASRDILSLSHQSAAYIRLVGPRLRLQFVTSLALPFDQPEGMINGAGWLHILVSFPNIRSLMLIIPTVCMSNNTPDINTMLEFHAKTAMHSSVTILCPRDLSQVRSLFHEQQVFATTLAREAVLNFGTVLDGGRNLGIVKINDTQQKNWKFFHNAISDLLLATKYRLHARVLELQKRNTRVLMGAIHSVSERKLLGSDAKPWL